MRWYACSSPIHIDLPNEQMIHLALDLTYFADDRCWVAAVCEPPPCQKCSTAQAQHSRQMEGWLPAGLDFQLPNRMQLHVVIRSAASDQFNSYRFYRDSTINRPTGSKAMQTCHVPSFACKLSLHVSVVPLVQMPVQEKCVTDTPDKTPTVQSQSRIHHLRQQLQAYTCAGTSPAARRKSRPGLQIEGF